MSEQDILVRGAVLVALCLRKYEHAILGRCDAHDRRDGKVTRCTNTGVMVELPAIPMSLCVGIAVLCPRHGYDPERTPQVTVEQLNGRYRRG